MLGGPPGWWPKAQAQRVPILRGVRAALGEADARQVLRFTYGPGPAGLVREAYAAGWWAAGAALAQGRSFAEIARWPEASHPERLAELIDGLLRGETAHDETATSRVQPG